MLILCVLTTFFVQKKVLKGGDSRYFWYIKVCLFLHKKCIKGVYTPNFGILKGVIQRGVIPSFVRPFVHPFVHPICPPIAKIGCFLHHAYTAKSAQLNPF
jgi:hypothetical protein